jgi:hypothetical protein
MDLEMKELMKEFITIWNKYLNILSLNCYEFDKYVNIINKIINECELELEIKDIKIFIELIEIMGDSIYILNNCPDKYESKYGITYYDKTKIYEEQELNCCSRLINYLEEDIYGFLV